MYFLGRQIFSNTLGGDDEVASIRWALDAAACIPGSGRYGAQRCEPRAGVACDCVVRAGAAGGAAEADAGARRVRDDAAEGRPRVGILRGASVAWGGVRVDGRASGWVGELEVRRLRVWRGGEGRCD